MIKTFNNHINLDNRNPTCFISTTGDPIRALSIAIKKSFCGEDDVHIAIIRSDKYLSGEAVAKKCFGLKPCLFKTEFSSYEKLPLPRSCTWCLSIRLPVKVFTIDAPI
jgi:hypothetical protein